MVYVNKEIDIQKGKLKFQHPYSWYDVTKSSYNLYISESWFIMTLNFSISMKIPKTQLWEGAFILN